MKKFSVSAVRLANTSRREQAVAHMEPQSAYSTLSELQSNGEGPQALQNNSISGAQQALSLPQQSQQAQPAPQPQQTQQVRGGGQYQGPVV